MKMSDEVLDRTFKDLPAIEAAIVTRCAEPAKAPALMDELAMAIVKAAFYANDAEPPAQVKGFVKADLGLGVETWALDGAWLAQPPAELKLKLEGDLRMHLVMVDDFMVISTSPRLTRELLAARAGEEKGRIAIPEVDGKLVGMGKIKGSTIARSLEQLGAVMAFVWELDEAPAARADAMVQMSQGMADLAMLVDVVEWEVVDEAKVRRTRARMKIVE
jgi:hypothetical protein